MAKPNFYKLLNLETTCTTDDVSKAWQVLKNKYPASSPQYKDCEKAYVTLVDPQKRIMYNAFGMADFAVEKSQTKFFLTDNVLQDKAAKQYADFVMQRKPNDIYRNVEVTLEDLFNGKTINIELKRQKVCSGCLGQGRVSQCLLCRGTAHVQNQLCQACIGRNTGALCKECLGAKSIIEKKNTSVVIEKGMMDGESIKCAEQTVNALNTSPRTAFIKLCQKPHLMFKRYGSDLFLTKKIGLSEALCGCKFVMTHLDGRKLVITAADTVLYPGCKKMIKGEGMPIYRSPDQERGDLIVFFQVSLPSSLSALKVDFKELEMLLPARPPFVMPDHPDTEEFRFTDFDPNYKSQLPPGKRMFDDDQHKIELPPNSQQRCTHQ